MPVGLQVSFGGVLLVVLDLGGFGGGFAVIHEGGALGLWMLLQLQQPHQLIIRLVKLLILCLIVFFIAISRRHNRVMLCHGVNLLFFFLQFYLYSYTIMNYSRISGFLQFCNFCLPVALIVMVHSRCMVIEHGLISFRDDGLLHQGVGQTLYVGGQATQRIYSRIDAQMLTVHFFRFFIGSKNVIPLREVIFIIAFIDC